VKAYPPGPRRADVLAVAGAGAYSSCMLSGGNLLRRPAVRDGAHRLLHREILLSLELW
jgi:hypothetical protein